ncbi:MAG: hypothetical protein J6Y02_08840 [Pseudobutyrivibrio sp.]|nr:hypothetical protein [Pseudobutyrivibrio sp.]
MYIVTELQTNGETTTVLTDVFTDESLANQKYYTILSFAAVSTIDIHSAAILNEYGGVLKNETFIHNTNSED